MVVQVFGIKNGLELFKDVTAVRIKSKDYNLLIFKGYVPIIGEIEGNFDIELKDNKISYEKVKAYYINNSNTFSIILGSDTIE